ncbi:hypothetical protein KCU99_g8134, partial [Aureobasidium melanogenum]
MAEPSNTWGPSSSPLMAQEKKAADANVADEANEAERSRNADQISPSGSTDDVLADSSGAIEEHIAGIKNILEKFEQTLKNTREKIDKSFSGLCEEVKALRDEISQLPQSGVSSRSQPVAPPSSNVQVFPRSNFDKQAPFNPVPADHPAYLFVVVSSTGSSRPFGYTIIGHEGGSFVTVEGLELARFDDEGRVFDMTPKNSFVDNFLNLAHE